MLEAMQQPVMYKVVATSRVKRTLTFSANYQLVTSWYSRDSLHTNEVLRRFANR